MSTPEQWNVQLVDKLLLSLATCIQISSDTRLYARFLMDKLREHWREYSKLVNANQLVCLLEHINVDDFLWIATSISQQACFDILVAKDRVTTQRLCLIKEAIKCNPQVAEAVLPVLKHLLDDPDVRIRRLAMEAIGGIDKDTLAANSSPLASRHKHLLKLIMINK